jgi:hypothetical protein
MKNIQVIDGANNAEYAIYAVTDDEFAVIFPGERQNVEFIEDLLERIGQTEAGRILSHVWTRSVNKPEVLGIHGTLFYELLWKKRYYPTKNDTEMVVPP